MRWDVFAEVLISYPLFEKSSDTLMVDPVIYDPVQLIISACISQTPLGLLWIFYTRYMLYWQFMKQDIHTLKNDSFDVNARWKRWTICIEHVNRNYTLTWRMLPSWIMLHLWLYMTLQTVFPRGQTKLLRCTTKHMVVINVLL